MSPADKSVVIYSTARTDTTDLIFSFAHGLRSIGNINVDTVDIQEYKAAGLRPDTDCFIFLGILRGTGLVFRECQQRNIDFIYVDHAYFNAGYERGWLRLTKNRHTMNVIRPCDSTRWDMYFAAENPLFKWNPQPSDDGSILVLPPTHAVAWMFDARDWLEQTIAEIKKYTDRPIIVRMKPSEPHVDENGELTGMIENESSATPLEEDIQRAHCIVAYNSNSSILATRMGVPVITAQYNPCFPISCAFNQLESDSLRDEPPREELFHWLAYNQFHVEELTSTVAWKSLFPT